MVKLDNYNILEFIKTASLILTFKVFIMFSPVEIFKTISKIPKCSKNAQKMRDFIISYASELNYEVFFDGAGNVLCRAGSGQNICLQAHYDMVCIGDVENIELIEYEGVLKAKNSTLGADNCIGVAYMLALMGDNRELEYLFTADEEIGLIGAKNIELSVNSKYMINTDTENENSITIGCAGGYIINAEFKYDNEMLEENHNVYELRSKNFQGGHSGFDVHKGIKNAIKESVYFLKSLGEPKIISINGGEKLNSIPKDVCIVFATAKELDGYTDDMFEITKLRNTEGLVAISDSKRLIEILIAMPNGVLGFDDEFFVVCDSVNLSIVKQLDNSIEFTIMGRSNSEALLSHNLLKVQTTLNLFGLTNVAVTDIYPAWEPRKTDFALTTKDIFRQTIETADFMVVHAGLECGVLKNKYPYIDIVSIGPNIYNPHSLSERVEIESVNKIYTLLKEIILDTRRLLKP